MSEEKYAERLSDAAAGIVRGTLDVVRAHAGEVAGVFYGSLFAAHPGLTDLFNQADQASGTQRAALAAAVVGFAEHLVDPTSEEFAPAERIAQKHVSLGVPPGLYPVVGDHLIAAVGTVLAVPPEVAAAWREVYDLFAARLTAREERLFAAAGVQAISAWRPWRVAKRHEEAVDAVSFTLVPDDGGPVPAFRPGQYVSVSVELPDGRRQPRQYSLSRGPRGDSLRITVRRVPGGAVSGFLHDHVRPDAVLLVGPPAGEVVLEPGPDPVVLISAGIGVTPMAAILDHVARTEPERPVVAVHVEHSADRHALRDECAAAGSLLADYREIRWNGRAEVDPAAIPLPPEAWYHLCGPVPFMADLWAALVGRGVPADRIRREVFGPTR
ncbi:globin domain-containing protein [Actinosynnema sp. NPDC020468]|uniref:globin domain-containing protein n=1 Tax=Actinosynnema sp. NPDC020468 TaxID=3154488 RepID=UPI0033CBC178